MPIQIPTPIAGPFDTESSRQRLDAAKDLAAKIAQAHELADAGQVDERLMRDIAEANAQAQVDLLRRVFGESLVEPSWDEIPVEVWKHHKKVTIYRQTVLRSWGANIETEMSSVPNTLNAVQDAMNWLYADDEVDANLRYLLDNCPYAVRDMSGEVTGIRGKEHVLGSLVLTFMGMQDRLRKAQMDTQRLDRIETHRASLSACYEPDTTSNTSTHVSAPFNRPQKFVGYAADGAGEPRPLRDAIDFTFKERA